MKKNIYDVLYEYHKFGYEKHFFPTPLLTVATLLCIIGVIATSPHASLPVIGLMCLLSVLAKREAHREGFVDGMIEASSIYSSSRGEGGLELYQDKAFYDELEDVIKFLKESK